jgi:hypothetical protein
MKGWALDSFIAPGVDELQVAFFRQVFRWGILEDPALSFFFSWL